MNARRFLCAALALSLFGLGASLRRGPVTFSMDVPAGKWKVFRFTGRVESRLAFSVTMPAAGTYFLLPGISQSLPIGSSDDRGQRAGRPRAPEGPQGGHPHVPTPAQPPADLDRISSSRDTGHPPRVPPAAASTGPTRFAGTPGHDFRLQMSDCGSKNARDKRIRIPQSTGLAQRRGRHPG